MVERGVPGLEQTGWDALRGQLNTLDTSLLFLALLTGATALSWAILSRQRGALLSLLSGEDIPEPDLIPARLAVSALVVGSLSYFFLLSLETESRVSAGAEEPWEEAARWSDSFLSAVLQGEGDALTLDHLLEAEP